MKRILSSLLLSFTLISLAQQGAPASPYYNGFNWTLTGTNLKDALTTKITTTHTNELTYPQAENALRFTDLDPTDATNTNVLMVYGYSPNICVYVDNNDFGTSADATFHRSRNKNADVSASNQCAWNREHIFAQALANPPLGQIGPGADAHMLRTCDVDRNTARGNRLYASGTGNSGTAGANWYPGDEWKGDVARILMYMYLHYGTQCLPTAVTFGTTAPSDANMPNLLLQWNAEDPISLYEDRRNTYLGNVSNTYGQGNRNPFIDNPYLATVIWGGPVAQNRWPTIFLETSRFNLANAVSVYPNPSTDIVNISSEVTIDKIEIITINGQILQQVKKPLFDNSIYSIYNLPKGFYFFKLSSDTNSVTKKIMIN
jgi:endonuclease I